MKYFHYYLCRQTMGMKWSIMSNLIDVSKNVDIVAVRKRINTLFSEAKTRAKPSTCILCGKNQTSFCNSHSVPKMSLKEIAVNGKVAQASTLMGIDYELIDGEKGINSSGTFNFICRSCDGTFFQDYEDVTSLSSKLTDKMLAEIAVKNMLLQLNRRIVEQEHLLILQREFDAYANLDYGLNVKRLDEQECREEVDFHKNIADNNLSDVYQVLIHEILPYRVPIAVQSAIVLIKDMEGIEVNNVYDMNKTTRMQYLHIAVFPLKNKSIVMMFYHKRDKNYRKLRHQLNASSLDKKLEFLNYLIFAYTENYYISPQISSLIKKNEKLQSLCQEINELPGLGMLGAQNNLGINYNPVKADEIPNLLSSAMAV